MQKEIKFNGYSAVPVDNISLEGDLDFSMNLLNEDSSLKPIAKPHLIGVIPQPWKAEYIHYNITYRHIILLNNISNELSWLDFPPGCNEIEYSESSISPLYLPDEYDNFVINSIVGVGNTLVVLTDKGLLYYLWKSISEDYIFLGDHLPECNMQFALSLDSSHLGLFKQKYINNKLEHPNHVQYFNTVTCSELNGSVGDMSLNPDYKEENTNSVLAGVNSVMEACKKKGFFLNNFFVRCAFRLYDGTLSMHSAPVLMICSSDHFNPIVLLPHTRSGNTVQFEVFAPKFKLKCISLMDKDNLEQWKDIIKSVDIFITPEIINYNADGEISNDLFRIEKQTVAYGLDYSQLGYPRQTYCIAENISSNIIGEKADNLFVQTFFTSLLQKSYPSDPAYETYKVIETPSFSNSVLNEKYSCNADFHFLYSYNIDKLPEELSFIPIEDEYLKTISQRELMTDDNFYHDKIIAKAASVYNSRINIANISRIPFDGYELNTISPLCSFSSSPHRYTLHFYIRENGKKIVVSKSSSSSIHFLSPFIFYPNPNVYKCILEQETFIQTGSMHQGYWSKSIFELPMQQHEMLNGSFYWSDFYHGGIYKSMGFDESLNEIIEDEPPNHFPQFCNQISNGPSEEELSSDRLLEYPNKIYTAQVNNPFVFSAENVNALGASEILALASVTKPLSAGQFGQFPLYAFTSEGIWALEISSTGAIASMHPVTRDVCTNIDSITQIDDAVLFISARGVMLLSGANVLCLSDVINTQFPFDYTTLPAICKLDKPFKDLVEKPQSFLYYLSDCNLLYDYIHQRIIVSPRAKASDEYKLSFVYSMRSKLWGMMRTNIVIPLNSYPDSIAISAANEILNYSFEGNDNKNENCLMPQMFITRPFQLELPNILKTIDTVIMRGEFLRGNVRILLYGSRDLLNWHLIWTSKDHYLRGFRGTPYKYFKIVSPCGLSAWESVSGCSVQFTPRLTNQPR